MPPMYLGTIQAPRRIARKVFAPIARRLDGDVGRRVADPEHEHPLAIEHLGLRYSWACIWVAFEGVLPGEGRLRPARVPVVAVGDDHVGVALLALPSSRA